MDSENGRMTRREYRAQLGLDTETPEKREKSRDAVARLILLQSVICAAMLCLLFGIRKLSPANFETLKNGYKSVMRYSMDAREAWGKIKSAVGFVFEPAGALANNESDSESSTESLGKGSSEPDVKAYKMSFSPYYTTVSAYMPVKGRISSPFGRRDDPFTDEASLHSGLDIAAEQGSPISAAFCGTVKKMGEDKIAGKYILLSHADGLETFYCHCSEIIAPVNAVIRRGETIALVGSTGMSTGPHLHFEVRINGLKYDPARLLFDGNA